VKKEMTVGDLIEELYNYDRDKLVSIYAGIEGYSDYIEVEELPSDTKRVWITG